MQSARYKTLLKVVFGVSLLWLLSDCKPPVERPSTPEYEIAAKWADKALYIAKNTPLNSPTYASRCFGYIGLTMYESIVDGYPEYRSLDGQLNGLGPLPDPDEDQEYNWKLSFIASQARILKLLYPQTSEENIAGIDSLEKVMISNATGGSDNRDLVQRSLDHGRSIADNVFKWAQTDGGHRAYLRNFDREWVHPEKAGSWKPPLYAQSFSHHPLHPHWGKNRTFLAENSDLPLPYMIPYDTVKGSAYYEQFERVYQKDLNLTQEEKEAAIWWGDDPDDTFTPPGHSFYIATLLIKRNKLNLIEAAETYAHVGIAVADAFINCWKWKYHFFSERPNTFIPQFIDREWESFWPDPPFPAFPSGHAIQAAAAACVLMDLFDNQTTFIDSAHVGRERDDLRNVDFVERKFNTIWDLALETADSRFYGGIHVPQDNEVGLTEGVRIAENVNHLNWKHKK